MAGKITIYDIAAHCNVSPATVSRVLGKSNYPVSEKTRALVLGAAQSLGYTSLGDVRKTAAEEYPALGVILPTVSNPHHILLMQGIQDMARQHGYQVLLSSSSRSVTTEKLNAQLLIHKQISGILIVSIDDTGSSMDMIAQSEIPFVAVEQSVNHDCNRTCFDFETGAHLAVQHLLDYGHRRIAFISPPLMHVGSRKKLLSGYRRMLIKNNIEIDERLICISADESDQVRDYERIVGENAVDALLSLNQPPTAMFCVNDMIAVGVIKHLEKRGLSVPEDVSVVGFDNIPLSSIVSPHITTIEQSGYDLGKVSADLLIKIISGKAPASDHTVTIQLDPRLVIRESTRALSPDC